MHILYQCNVYNLTGCFLLPLMQIGYISYLLSVYFYRSRVKILKLDSLYVSKVVYVTLLLCAEAQYEIRSFRNIIIMFDDDDYEVCR